MSVPGKWRGEWRGKIAGFWRRLGAVVIDLVLLGIAGMILGALLFDTLARIGAYARLTGFAIALAYFGVCNSRIGGGQTLGKRWLGVRLIVEVVEPHRRGFLLQRASRTSGAKAPWLTGLPGGSRSC